MVRITLDQRLTFRNVRHMRGITLTHAAKHIGITPKSLSDYEKDVGTMPLDIALKLLDLYEFPRKSLVFN
ncbi:helix-turn-helix domain-containing protein [Paenibacillus medicaginis]|uniref:Helix-turn-helix domain-containing protein n=1 Tax=Paenibacillus medicaginis TaxID=1470560 RepID=A0ABV5C0G3_9BACL